MPKKRKTRKEKVLLDQKRQTVHQDAPPIVSSPKNEPQQEQQSSATGMTFSLPSAPEQTHEVPQKTQPASQTISVPKNEYAYISNDLMRTALLTGAIVFAELLIRLFFVH